MEPKAAITACQTLIDYLLELKDIPETERERLLSEVLIIEFYASEDAERDAA